MTMEISMKILNLWRDRKFLKFVAVFLISNASLFGVAAFLINIGIKNMGVWSFFLTIHLIWALVCVWMFRSVLASFGEKYE